MGNDLLVTAVAARQKALYVQAGGFGHKPPRGTRGDQPVLAQNLPIGNAELNHQFFLCIMCNKGNRHKKSPTFYKLQHSMAMRFLSKTGQRNALAQNAARKGVPGNTSLIV